MRDDHWDCRLVATSTLLCRVVGILTLSIQHHFPREQCKVHLRFIEQSVTQNVMTIFVTQNVMTNYTECDDMLLRMWWSQINLHNKKNLLRGWGGGFHGGRSRKIWQMNGEDKRGHAFYDTSSGGMFFLTTLCPKAPVPSCPLINDRSLMACYMECDNPN
jgi:hypothetical protein